ncbi:PQQ-binding-like beta-propeller repeat protein [Fimbriiglobus ruber]|uniref:Putative serine/threonine protein kinase n=1 Tax=Fimbriiglobus ruber TaxID=1908690 RepID=A0A225DX97_9BACT|nr:PQQ-binding-like beta-propeller repeat protein [Fimbriiglobus ruber]OWK43118.1 putative serine/threonine protein kinase [Fimbriiglobus ruber]
MPRFLPVLGLLVSLATGPASAAYPVTVGPADWPWWRGPTRDGVAPPNQTPPQKWSATENVLWKAPVPGRGHGSPAVVGDRVFLAVADAQTETQAVHCFDRKTGELAWATVVHRGGFETKGNAKSSLASSTPACDGRRVFINFQTANTITTTALDLNGKILWQRKVSDFVQHQGFGSSPAVYGPLVLVTADNKGGGAAAGLDRETGTVVWTRTRPKLPNYTSPVILPIGGKDQLLLTGCDLVTSLDPLTGSQLWEHKGATTECVTSTVTDGRHVFTSGGYPKNHLAAVTADGSGKVAWESGARVYVPSLLYKDGHLYGVQDEGVAVCWRCDTGKQVWKERLGGTFSASPVLVGDVVYSVNEAGKWFLFKATPEAFTLVAENKLGDEVFATPTICGDHIYARVAEKVDGQRKEWLYCLGKQ